MRGLTTAGDVAPGLFREKHHPTQATRIHPPWDSHAVYCFVTPPIIPHPLRSVGISSSITARPLS